VVYEFDTSAFIYLQASGPNDQLHVSSEVAKYLEGAVLCYVECVDVLCCVKCVAVSRQLQCQGPPSLASYYLLCLTVNIHHLIPLIDEYITSVRAPLIAWHSSSPNKSPEGSRSNSVVGEATDKVDVKEKASRQKRVRLQAAMSRIPALSTTNVVHGPKTTEFELERVHETLRSYNVSDQVTALYIFEWLVSD
jgi:hypothetical protein